MGLAAVEQFVALLLEFAGFAASLKLLAIEPMGSEFRRRLGGESEGHDDDKERNKRPDGCGFHMIGLAEWSEFWLICEVVPRPLDADCDIRFQSAFLPSIVSHLE